MSVARTARERVRAELLREITEIARRRLATDGAAGLSLRAIAREMGMVSSAIHRYFPTRDDLFTALIIDGYHALGEAVERADADVPRTDHAGRWLAIATAVREWALAHPHEYALLYGSPVPGYRAPAATIAPAIRSVAVFGRIISEAYAAGALDTSDSCVPPPVDFGADAARVREAIMPGVPDDVVAGALTAWPGLFGAISFELFGQFENTIVERDARFRHSMACLGRLVGLR
jgi:AcrR family transcriptional regulator